MVTVTPIWAAHLHTYARAGTINSLRFNRFKSASRHRADKTKRSHVENLGFVYFRFNFKMTSKDWVLANFNFKSESAELLPKDF